MISIHNSITNERFCKQIILDILDKLWAIHKCGFIHRDLEPDNIMYRDPEFNASCPEHQFGWKVIDFGSILKRVTAENNTYKYEGTRGWTAPETNVDSTDNKYSLAVDIWHWD